MKKDIVPNLIGALVVTLLCSIIFGFQGWGITVLHAASIFVAFMVMDGIKRAWAQSHCLRSDMGIVALLLILALIAAFPISMMLDLNQMEVATLVAILFAGLGISGMILIAWRNRHR